MGLEKIANEPRIVVRRDGAPDASGTVVLYWMQRAQRARDNPALETAIEVANAIDKPVVVYFQLTTRSPGANLRHYRFMVEGLADVADELARRGVGFVMRCHRDGEFERLCRAVVPAIVIGDENPLRAAERQRSRTAARLKVPYWTVDADVIVPSCLLRREHYAARTIRPLIRAQLPRFLCPIRRHAPRRLWTPARQPASLRPDANVLARLQLDRSIGTVEGSRGGSRAARSVLRRFLKERLKGYADNRNRPERDATSQLSPYLHFGHIGPHTVALAVRDSGAPSRDRGAFLEELIVRRELAINFVRYNPDYDRFTGAEPWARRTLDGHRGDARPHQYSFRALEHAETHDPLWNAAQRQMVLTGWMHGYLRMYWAKKILEWSESPEAAYAHAIALNDRYELDGRDPNGYAGVAWAVAGKHDRAWGPERPLYGTVRYMSYASTSRQFDSAGYIARVDAIERRGRAAEVEHERLAGR